MERLGAAGRDEGIKDWGQKTGELLKRSSPEPPQELLWWGSTILLSNCSVNDLPQLPQLHNGQREILLLWRPAGTRRLVLRLWPSDYALKSSGQPLLLGAVESQYAQHLILSLPRASHDYNQAFETLHLSLDQTRTSYQLRRRTNHHPNQPENPKNQSQWNGWVLLGGVGK